MSTAVIDIGESGYAHLENRRTSGEAVSGSCKRISQFVLGLGMFGTSAFLASRLIGPAKQHLAVRVAEYAFGVLATAAIGTGLCADAIKPGLGMCIAKTMLRLPGIVGAGFLGTDCGNVDYSACTESEERKPERRSEIN